MKIKIIILSFFILLFLTSNSQPVEKATPHYFVILLKFEKNDSVYVFFDKQILKGKVMEIDWSTCDGAAYFIRTIMPKRRLAFDNNTYLSYWFKESEVFDTTEELINTFKKQSNE